MKKQLLAFTLAFIMMTGFTSCKKDWTCQCTDQSGNQTSSAINNETLLNATSTCKDKDVNYTVAGVTVSESCKLQ
jgi:hypothetical protein